MFATKTTRVEVTVYREGLEPVRAGFNLPHIESRELEEIEQPPYIFDPGNEHIVTAWRLYYDRVQRRDACIEYIAKSLARAIADAGRTKDKRGYSIEREWV